MRTHTLVAADQITRATFVPARGGAASSIIMPGVEGPRELLFLHDTFWQEKIDDLPGGWPFCFPVCGRLESGTYWHDGKLYQLPIHGFAWQLAWEVIDCEADSITMRLRDSAHTLAQYPFSFTVELRYQVSPGALTCEQFYRNDGEQPMPYYAGFHPYFLTPPAASGKAQVQLQYQPLQRFQYNASYTGIAREVPVFTTPISVAAAEINQQLTWVGLNKEVALHFPTGEVITLEAAGCQEDDLFPFIQLYTEVDQPFFCVEPWMSFPNAMNSGQVRWLQPGQSERGILTCRCAVPA